MYAMYFNWQNIYLLIGRLFFVNLLQTYRSSSSTEKIFSILTSFFLFISQMQIRYNHAICDGTDYSFDWWCLYYQAVGKSKIVIFCEYDQGYVYISVILWFYFILPKMLPFNMLSFMQRDLCLLKKEKKILFTISRIKVWVEREHAQWWMVKDFFLETYAKYSLHGVF